MVAGSKNAEYIKKIARCGAVSDWPLCSGHCLCLFVKSLILKCANCPMELLTLRIILDCLGHL